MQLVNNKKLNNLGSTAMDVGVGMLVGSAIMQAFEKSPVKAYNKFTAVLATATYLAGFVAKTCTEIGAEVSEDAIKTGMQTVSENL
jgi:hypothetical protein